MRAVFFTLALLSLWACGDPPKPSAEPLPRNAEFVGSEHCGSCHVEEHAAWSTSHHGQAMQAANDSTFLGTLPIELDGLRIERTGDGIIAVNSEGTRFPITHTFGVYPLQQYLAETAPGRLQALRLSWDSREAALGGQRWFLQYPGEHIGPDDVLHWRGYAQNWNGMCADCHSTSVSKGYDAASDAFDTRFAELTVGCEACHGPGAQHAEDPLLPLPATLALSDATTQPEVCAPCHSRRSQIAEGFEAGDALLDHYVPALLNPPLYQKDGRIDDEVYVYGSFTSSLMYRAGVTCSDCHTPHNAELKMPGDAVCMQCHSPAGNPRFASLTKKRYDAIEHHGQTMHSQAARCVTCHMPSKTYMGVDVRHDHSMRLPVPRAADHWQSVFAGSDAAMQLELADLASQEALNPIVRATAISRLAAPSTSGIQRAVFSATRSTAALVRHSAASQLHLLPQARRQGAFKRLIADPVLAVRLAAVDFALRDTAPNPIQPELQRALDEYRQSLARHRDQPDANVGLAALEAWLGDPSAALAHLDQALAINPNFIPALLRYADMLEGQGKIREAGDYLLTAINGPIATSEADYAYAMWLVRQGQQLMALPYLRRAVERSPTVPQWSYAYAIALHSLDQGDEALAFLRGLDGRPVKGDALAFLHATIARDLGQRAEALGIVDELLTRAPGNRQYQALYRALSSP